MATKTIYKVVGPEGGAFAIQDVSGVAQMQLDGTNLTMTAAQSNYVSGVTAGTIAASKAVVVDANKDASAFRNLTLTNLDAGASGTAGSVDVFPTTAAKGKIAITAADSAGDTTTTVTNASQAGARTYTIPDNGASGWFAVGGAGTATATAGAATLSQLSGKITSEALTTAAGADYTLTITNTLCAAGDLVFASVDNGTNTTAGISVQRVTPGAGTIVILVRNTHASAALNGTIKVSFMVVKTA